MQSAKARTVLTTCNHRINIEVEMGLTMLKVVTIFLSSAGRLSVSTGAALHQRPLRYMSLLSVLLLSLLTLAPVAYLLLE